MLLLLSISANAQIVKGDMNDDGALDISDVVSSVNVILGSQPMSYISASDIMDPYLVDNSKVIGTWYKTKTETVTFGEDGTTDYTGATKYEFMPYQGRLILYNSADTPIGVLNILKATDDYLYISEMGTSTVSIYTKSKPVYKVSSITLSETSIVMKAGATQQLTVTVAPADADDSSVTWASSDESVATVIDGLITAIAPGAATISCSANDGSGITATCSVIVPEPVKVSSITLSETTIILEPDATKRLTATIFPDDAEDKSVTWSSNDENIATVINGLVIAIGEGIATITCSANDGSGATATCRVRVGDYPYVDLGLPSGTLWATMNVGANSPEDYGDYFAWGETVGYNNGYTTFNWSKYKYCNGSYNTLTKYCNKSDYGYNGFTDTLTELEPEDDAAYVNWGIKWRMPTDAQWTELRTECTWSWTKQNDVNGYLVTGPNGNSIFIPAAGCRYNDSLINAGSYGCYWSRSLNTAYPSNAHYVDFYSDNVYRYGSFRYYGYSVRPVRSE